MWSESSIAGAAGTPILGQQNITVWQVLHKVLMNGEMLPETNLFQIEHGFMEWATVIFITTPLRDKSCFHIGRVRLVYIVQGDFNDSYTEDHRLVSL
ncbi:hypothetical protein C6H68_14165 [Photorhabdus luminescens]|nr:hypothetical protein C6H68_14165 [Photorhabdus luminescens]